MQSVHFYLEKQASANKTVFMLNDDLSDLQYLAAAFVSKEILTFAGPLKAYVIVVVLPLLLFGNGPRKNRLYLAMFHILEGLWPFIKD